MANNRSTTNSFKKTHVVIAIVLVLLLVTLFSFRSCSRDESLEGEQGITNTVPHDEGKDREENVVQENSDQTDKNENGSLNSNSANSTGNMTQSNSGNDDVSSNVSQGNINQSDTNQNDSDIDNGAGSNTQDNGSNNNDHSSGGSQDSLDQIGPVPSPEQPNIPESDASGSKLNLLYDELIKANKTFQYLLELTNEILENY